MPFDILGHQVFTIAGIDRRLGRIISGEVTGIDIQATDDARYAKFDDAKVVARAALAATLPTVHPFAVVIVLIGDKNRVRRIDQAFFGAEEFVVCEYHS